MKLDNKVVFVSGANRGIGKAIVEQLLKHPVKKIYASARKPSDLPNFGDDRVVPVTLDITNRNQIEKAIALAGDTDLLINNAGALSFATVVTGEPEALMRDMQVNYLAWCMHLFRCSRKKVAALLLMSSPSLVLLPWLALAVIQPPKPRCFQPPKPCVRN